MSSLASLRSSLSPGAVELLTAIWFHYYISGTWPTSLFIHSQFGKLRALELRKEMGATILYDTDQCGSKQLQLTVIGVLLTTDGRQYERLLVRYLQYLREVCLATHQKVAISRSELASTLGLDGANADLVCQLMSVAKSSTQSSSVSKDTASFAVLDEMEKFSLAREFTPKLEKHPFRN